MMTERAHDPAKGKLGLPGGFLERGETAEEGLIREVKEEVGIAVDNLEYLCSSPNRYEFGGIVYDTLDLFYTAVATSTDTTLDDAEVAAVHWRQVQDIHPDELAFESFHHAFEILKRKLAK